MTTDILIGDIHVTMTWQVYMVSHKQATTFIFCSPEIFLA